MWHNHLSGSAEPSPNVISLISRAKDLVEEVNVRLLDRVVLSRTEIVGMAVAPRPALRNLQCVHSSMRYSSEASIPADFIRWLRRPRFSACLHGPARRSGQAFPFGHGCGGLR